MPRTQTHRQSTSQPRARASGKRGRTAATKSNALKGISSGATKDSLEAANQRFCSDAFIHGWVLENKRDRTVALQMADAVREVLEWSRLDMGKRFH